MKLEAERLDVFRKCFSELFQQETIKPKAKAPTLTTTRFGKGSCLTKEGWSGLFITLVFQNKLDAFRLQGTRNEK